MSGINFGGRCSAHAMASDVCASIDDWPVCMPAALGVTTCVSCNIAALAVSNLMYAVGMECE